ncbi:MAG: dihydropyrimidine dehydrogenase [Epulopiscium sp. Nuni2H_MBin001]|nr:MAG: dihydropyrimidine dehydrogenase [Epulopiscium sp. Nuni2H_MBin001]
MDLLSEAKRCLKCKKARCQINCPISTPIPDIITLFQEGKNSDAGELLFENNPLSSICALVCPHESQCLGNCIRGIKSEPIPFYQMEAVISSDYLKSLKIQKPEPNGKRIAIIGSGPAGITVALKLATKGYKITIFEMNEQIGGALKYAIPNFRLPAELLNNLEKMLTDLGVFIRTNTMVGPIITLDKLLSDGYDAVFIGTGVWNPRPLNIKGESLGHALYAIDYLKAPHTYNLTGRVCVIGAGDVAMDAARCAKRYGADEVEIVYRRKEEEMPATKHEIKGAKDDGIIFNLNKMPIEITDDGLIVQSTHYIEEADGTQSLETIAGSDQLLEYDYVIIAVSQIPKSNIVSHTTGLQVKYGLIVTDKCGNTTREGVFASGDVVSGAKTVVKAVNGAKIVADSIDEYCMG